MAKKYEKGHYKFTSNFNLENAVIDEAKPGVKAGNALIDENEQNKENYFSKVLEKINYFLKLYPKD